MPSATRKMNANSGNAGSAFAKWNTWLKKTALTPSAAANDSTTVAIRISGATSARSTIARTIRITSSTSGMIRLRSCREASCTSRLTADWPPTSASAPGTAPTACRIRWMVAYAASES